MILAYKDTSPAIAASVFVASSVDVVGDVAIGEEASLWFGAVIRGDMNYVRIGRRTNIQDNCTVHVTTDVHPTFIGDEVTVGHNVIIHGCRVGDHCLIGMGAVIMDGVEVGEGSLIAAGAVLTPGTKVPPGSLFAGVPGKFRREVTAAEYDDIVASAEHYVRFSRDYLAAGVGQKLG